MVRTRQHAENPGHVLDVSSALLRLVLVKIVVAIGQPEPACRPEGGKNSVRSLLTCTSPRNTASTGTQHLPRARLSALR